MREAKDCLEARVLRAVSVGGIRGGSWVSFAGVVEGGGVPGRGRVKGRMILARRGEERSGSEVSALLTVSMVLVVMSASWAGGMLLLMSLFAWCMMVSVEGIEEMLGESATVTKESLVWLLPLGESGRSMGPCDPIDDVSTLPRGEMTPMASS